MYVAMNYDLLSDKELIKLIIEDNEEAVVYLLHDRYIDDIKYHIWHKFDSYDDLDGLIDDFYIYLKGSGLDWKPLRSFNGSSSFRTWFNTVIERFMLKKRLKKDRNIGDRALFLLMK